MGVGCMSRSLILTTCGHYNNYIIEINISSYAHAWEMYVYMQVTFRGYLDPL